MTTKFKLLGTRLNLDYKYLKPDFTTSLTKNVFPELNGTLSGRYPIRIYLYNNRNLKHAFEIKSTLNNSNFFSIKLQSAFNKFGLPESTVNDIQIRDNEFDNKFIINSNNELFAKKLLADPDFRDLFLINHQLLAFGEMSIKNGMINYHGVREMSKNKEIDDMEALVNLGLAIAQKLEEIDSES